MNNHVKGLLFDCYILLFRCAAFSDPLGYNRFDIFSYPKNSCEHQRKQANDDLIFSPERITSLRERGIPVHSDVTNDQIKRRSALG